MILTLGPGIFGIKDESSRILGDSKELTKINCVHRTKKHENRMERDVNHKRFHRNVVY